MIFVAFSEYMNLDSLESSWDTKGWFDEFDTNVISVFDIFACNFGKDWATETCFTSNEQLKPFLFG